MGWTRVGPDLLGSPLRKRLSDDRDVKLPKTLSVPTLMLFSAVALAVGPHTNLNEASDALRRAKSSYSMDDLKKARKSLQDAVEVQGSPKRKEALNDVVEAVQALESGDRLKATKLIDEALKCIDQAVGGDYRKK
jgi:cellobiose-specific phosphotransferase system component IIA